jgi:hypothetical protein
VTLPPAEREFAHKLEMTHGVIIRVDPLEGGLQACHWRDDTVLADADTVYELEKVLKSLHIYADADAPDVIPTNTERTT